MGIPWVTLLNAVVILQLSSSTFLIVFSKSLSFTNFNRKNSGGVKSGVQAGRSLKPYLPILEFENKSMKRVKRLVLCQDRPVHV